MIPINVTIDGQSVADELVSCTIQMDEMSYCWTINIDLKSKLFWNACDPNERAGTPRIKLIIGDDVYSFLCEERSTSREKEFSMSVWGRTKQALLSRPYSQAAYAVSDEYGSLFTWETSAVPASEVIQTVIDEFCPYSVTVNWNVEDYLVYPGSLSIENNDPISVISQLAEAIGAILVPQIDGSLNVEYYDVLEGEIVADYDDSIEILSASEEVPTRNGINAVVVSGASSASSKQVWLTAEKKEETHTVTSCFDSFETDTTIYTYVSFDVRVYFYNADPSAVLSKYFPYGSVIEGVTGIESITETVELVFGSGNTSKTNTDGETGVVGDPDVPLEYREVTYNVNYRDYTITATEEGDIGIIFYYSAENYVVYSFTATDACSWEDICDGVVLLPSCDYPDEEKYVDSSYKRLGYFAAEPIHISHRDEKTEKVWSGGHGEEGTFGYKTYNMSWSTIGYSRDFRNSAITQLGLSGKYKNLSFSGDSIYGIYLERPVNGSLIQEELLAYAPSYTKYEVTESLDSYTWASGYRYWTETRKSYLLAEQPTKEEQAYRPPRGLPALGTTPSSGGARSPDIYVVRGTTEPDNILEWDVVETEEACYSLVYETVWFIAKDAEAVTYYNNRNSALLELLLSGQFFDIRLSGDDIYGKRKGRPKNITSSREIIAHINPTKVYYDFSTTYYLRIFNQNVATYNEQADKSKSEFDNLPVDFSNCDYYYDYSNVTQTMLSIQNSGKWCDLAYYNGTILGRRISPVVSGDYYPNRELIGVANVADTSTDVNITVFDTKDENGSETTKLDVTVVTVPNDYSELASLEVSIATGDMWIRSHTSWMGDLAYVYGYRRKRAIEEDADYAPGDEIEIKVYFDGTSISEKWCSYGSLSFVRTGYEKFEEEIEFLNGEASTEYPISSLYSINYHHNDENQFPDPAYTKGGKNVICTYLKNKLQYRLVGASIVYYSTYQVYKVAIPSNWQGNSFSIGFCFDGCEDPKIVEVSVGNKKGTDLTGLRLLHNNNFVGVSNTNSINFVDGE